MASPRARPSTEPAASTTTDVGLGGATVDGQDGGLPTGRFTWLRAAGHDRPCYGSPTVGAKVAVVGGGSTYTPELVESLCDHEDRLVVDELVLLDPDADRLEPVAGLSERILRHRGLGRPTRHHRRSGRAIDGADFVVVQLRVGGQAARHADETLPVGYGCLGQETTGPGGLAKALRTVPLVLELAEETAARAAPGAWLVDFTNPVGIVTQALADEGHRAVGLCNVASWVQRRIGHYLGVDPDDGRARARRAQPPDLGPLGRVAGPGPAPRAARPLRPRARARERCPRRPAPAPRGAALLLPPLLLRPRRRAGRPAGGPGYRPRADVVAELEAELLAEYRDPDLVTKPEKLSWRGGAFYSEAAVRLMASLHAGTGDVQVVDVRNDGSLPGLPDDAVVEVPAVVDAEGAHALPQRRLPPDMLGLVEHCKAYERLAVEAAMSGSRDAVVRALLANPLVGQYPLAERPGRRPAGGQSALLAPLLLGRRVGNGARRCTPPTSTRRPDR